MRFLFGLGLAGLSLAVGQAHLAAEAATSGAATARWVHLLASAGTLTMGVIINVMTRETAKRGDVPQQAEGAGNGAHHRHG